MAVRSIVLYPNPLLRQKAAPADAQDPQTAEVLRDIEETLDSHSGVGLAAPQIGYSVRAIAVDATRARRPVANHGRMLLLNPSVVAAEGRTRFREGCMSIPDLVAHVDRAERVTVVAQLADGSPTTFTAEGFEAVIVQHEIDHLDGVLFIDRVNRASDIKAR
jgi:peptide deformylase